MAVPVLGKYFDGFGSVPADQLNTYEQVTPKTTDLRAFTGLQNMQVFAQSYSTVGDGGAGPFVYNTTSTATDDGGVTCIQPTGQTIGRWIRLGFLTAASQSISQFQFTTTTFNFNLNFAAGVTWEYATIECIGGGGGGGGAAANANTWLVGGGGGGSGAYARTNVHPVQATDNLLQITIGGAGVGGNGAANGTAGGQTMVTGTAGTLVAANGGKGGAFASSAASILAGIGGLGGDPTNPVTAGLGFPGNAGETGVGLAAATSTTIGYVAQGGEAFYGGRNISQTVGAGAANGPNAMAVGNAYGCGGGGGVIAASNTTVVVGGNGGSGVVNVTIYYTI